MDCEQPSVLINARLRSLAIPRSNFQRGRLMEMMHAYDGCQTPFRVYIIEPEVLLGKALCRLFADDREIEMVGDCTAFDSQALVEAKPDLVLIDSDNISDVRETIARCRSAVPGAKICALSSHLRPELMLRVLWAGADGYVVKDRTPDELALSLKRVLSDGFHADPRLTSALLRNQHASNVPQLSARELDVAKLIGEGLSNREISERLLLSDKTVKNHVSNIFSKLNVSARTQVAIYIHRNGLI
jgi:two-component system, NarL family, response regulator LiaR